MSRSQASFFEAPALSISREEEIGFKQMNNMQSVGISTRSARGANRRKRSLSSEGQESGTGWALPLEIQVLPTSCDSA